MEGEDNTMSARRGRNTNAHCKRESVSREITGRKGGREEGMEGGREGIPCDKAAFLIISQSVAPLW